MYSKHDLTVIVPTLGRDLALLQQVAARVDAADLALRIVWDGRNPLTDEIRQTILGMARQVEIIEHTHNRGLSAARNTGAKDLPTALGMFIDDDIIPREGFADDVIAFHNHHTDPLTMLMGCVSWRNTPYANSLTEWFETLGNWSVFHTATAGQPLSNFMGGFTSFKADALQGISFDESFTRYGCEDVEFGYRFFRQGGRLVYWPSVHGAHHKQLDLATYCRDHVGAGHSRGILMRLHPDVAFDFNLICRAILHPLPASHHAALMQCAEHFLSSQHAASSGQEIHALMQTLTEHSMQTGLAEYLCAQHTGFAQAYGTPDMDADALVNNVDDFAPFLVMRAKQSKNAAARQTLLNRAQELMPHYAEPYLLRVKWAGALDTATQAALATFHAAWNHAIDMRTERAILQHLGRTGTAQHDPNTLSARDLFFRMEEAARSARDDEVARLAEMILTKDATYVGAYIAWARTLPGTDNALRRLLLRLAEHFVKNRPAHEQAQRRAEILALAAETTQINSEQAR
ncbi:glycosyltransferase family 2 protein [Uliginosibacterium gangwonense]|uniref:glycosyltransferase family 2 protein n=1 Tax=Uliginosibacterium gangwonense TaxID=392736 RepID=UPI00037BE85B|nr:glycosyltransferase [Uliginosibacterium gangwonense]